MLTATATAAAGSATGVSQRAGLLETVVQFGDQRYPYFAAAEDTAWEVLNRKLTGLDADRFILVTEKSLPDKLRSMVARHVGEVAPTATLTFTGGEPAKTVATLDALAAEALSQGATRRSCIVAIGGGLVGNVAGLLAALLFRGVRLIQIPTTLLAQSDSVLSLKQAVNSQAGKNHIGTFATPEFVWSNVDFLDLLPVSERQAAMCEVIKNVVAIRPEDYEEVSGLLRSDAEYAPEEYVRVIELAIAQKTAVMGNDKHEKGRALVLEYGHTVGHALEATLKGRLTHGLAVGVGMTVAAEVAQAMRLSDDRVRTMLHEMLEQLGAPTMIPAEAEPAALMALVALDNKRGYLKQVPGSRDMVLLSTPGTALWTDGKPLTPVPDQVIAAAIRRRRVDTPHTRRRLGRSGPASVTVRMAGGV